MTASAGRAWRCTVCGYVHQGSEAPEWCPICGAAQADFEPFETDIPAAAPKATQQWRCLNCGYLHQGEEAPEACPVCAAARDRFESLAEKQHIGGSGGVAEKVVVLGAGIAGVSAVESLRQASPDAEITLISKEGDLPYYRLNLTRFLAGEITRDQLPVHPEPWYGEQGIALHREAEVASLLLEEKAVQLLDGEKVPFEKLVVTMGAHPFIPPFPGAQREGVTSLRTSNDALHILNSTRKGMACVCIGGGILGLETAGALARQGLDVTLLEGHPWLMPRQLNPEAGELLMERVRGMGIQIATRARTREIQGDERVSCVLLEDGRRLPAEFVVITTGIRPNSHLARRAGLEVDKGIVVDNHLRSSHPDVYAAGDVAEHRGVLYGNWSASQFQGNIAGMNAAGLSTEFGGIPRSNMLKVLGVDMLSIGRFEPDDGSFEVIEAEHDGRYYRFVFRDGALVGSVLLGDTRISGPVKKAVESRGDCSNLLKLHPGALEVRDHFLEQAG
jgi:nitrite reductase (NADH) large subunit